jgi:hypothetical protein
LLFADAKFDDTNMPLVSCSSIPQSHPPYAIILER